MLVTIVCIGLFAIAKGQQTDTSRNNQIFTAVEQEPVFPGGTAKLNEYLQSNLKYPPVALKNKLTGKVILAFVVEKDGSLSDIKVLVGATAEMNEEAIRLMKESPKWIAGMQNGKPRRVEYSVPVIFNNLQEPVFPGGIDKFFSYLQDNLKYPAKSLKKHIEGGVYVRFFVDTDGSTTDIMVVRSVSSDIDAEAVRLIKNSPQ